MVLIQLYLCTYIQNKTDAVIRRTVNNKYGIIQIHFFDYFRDNSFIEQGLERKDRRKRQTLIGLRKDRRTRQTLIGIKEGQKTETDIDWISIESYPG